MNAHTKPGKYGTLYLYEITYTDSSDAGCGEMTARVWRYSLEHVVDAFDQSHDSDGWNLLRAARVPLTGGMHRAVQRHF